MVQRGWLQQLSGYRTLRYLLPTVCTAQLGESPQFEQASAVSHPCGPSMQGVKPAEMLEREKN